MPDLSSKAEELAEQNDVTEGELLEINGSGEDGRVLADDVRKFVKNRDRMSDHVEEGEWCGYTNFNCLSCGTFRTVNRMKMIAHLERCLQEEE